MAHTCDLFLSNKGSQLRRSRSICYGESCESSGPVPTNAVYSHWSYVSIQKHLDNQNAVSGGHFYVQIPPNHGRKWTNQVSDALFMGWGRSNGMNVPANFKEPGNEFWFYSAFSRL